MICEGQTEEMFVKEVLSPDFPELALLPMLVGPRGKRGGGVTYQRTLRSITPLLRQERNCTCTTFLDLYGLGEGWSTSVQRDSNALEQYLAKGVAEEMGSGWNPIRFRAHIQPHEFESLLFSNPAALALALRRQECSEALVAIADQFESPEHINNSPETCPSRRLGRLIPGYRKPLFGTMAAQAVGLADMELKCRHFAQWLAWLRTL